MQCTVTEIYGEKYLGPAPSDLYYVSQLHSPVFPERCILGYQNVLLAHI